MTDATADPPRVARARLGVKNQLTLPKAIVDTLGARPGDTLVFRADPRAGGTVQIQLVRRTYAGSMSGMARPRMSSRFFETSARLGATETGA